MLNALFEFLAVIVSCRTPCSAVQECPRILFSNADIGKTVEIAHGRTHDTVQTNDTNLPVRWIRRWNKRNKHANGSATILSVNKKIPSAVTLEDGTKFRVPGKRYKFMKAHLESDLVHSLSKCLGQ